MDYSVFMEKNILERFKTTHQGGQEDKKKGFYLDNNIMIMN